MPNEKMAAYWTRDAGPEWVDHEAEFDHLLEPFGRAALEALALAPGESVLDVGCGFGTTVIEAAELVGPSGRVVGIDVSPVMIERAELRAQMRMLDNVSFLVADAQVHRFERPVDTIVSRFGVMFFEDPVAAFSNLHSVVRPGGRLAFVCWQPMGDNPWMNVSAVTWAPYLTEPPALLAPDAPGPFAFADPGRVRSLLGDAGWGDVEIAAFHTDARLGGGRGLEGAVEQSLATSTGRALRSALPAEQFDDAVNALRDALRAHLRDGEVILPAAAWVVTARR